MNLPPVEGVQCDLAVLCWNLPLKALGELNHELGVRLLATDLAKERWAELYHTSQFVEKVWEARR